MRQNEATLGWKDLVISVTNRVRKCKLTTEYTVAKYNFGDKLQNLKYFKLRIHNLTLLDDATFQCTIFFPTLDSFSVDPAKIYLKLDWFNQSLSTVY